MTDDPPPQPRAAGTGVLLFALAFPAVLTWAYFIALAEAPAGWQQAAYGAGKAIQFGLPLVWVVFVLGRRVRLRPPTLAGLGAGVAFGLLAGGLMFGLCRLVLEPAGLLEEPGRLVQAKVTGIGINGAAGFAVVGVGYSLVHSLLEEYYWRWFVFGELDRRIPRWSAILVSSAGFTAHHVLILAYYFGAASPLTYLAAAGVAAGGCAWAWLFARTGSLYGPWLSHCLVDATIFAIGYELIA